MPDLKAIRADNARMLSDVSTAIDRPIESTTEDERQLLATFGFGMVYAAGQTHALSPPEVHALLIAVLQDFFKYSDQQAVAFAEMLIQAASDRAEYPLWNAIIHHGIDGHAQWHSGDIDGLRKNFSTIYDRVQKAMESPQ